MYMLNECHCFMSLLQDSLNESRHLIYASSYANPGAWHIAHPVNSNSKDTSKYLKSMFFPRSPPSTS